MPIAYVPIAQAPRMQIKLAVRTRGDATPRRAVDPRSGARRSIRSSRSPTSGPRTDLGAQPVGIDGSRSWLIGIFAALSALLAALGLYGVVSHSVSQQQREIGIRMALGARSSEVLSMVVAQRADRRSWPGSAIGLVGAVALTRVTRSLLFEVSALDPFAFATAAVAMAAGRAGRGARAGNTRDARRPDDRPAIGLNR